MKGGGGEGEGGGGEGGMKGGGGEGEGGGGEGGMKVADIESRRVGERVVASVASPSFLIVNGGSRAGTTPPGNPGRSGAWHWCGGGAVYRYRNLTILKTAVG